MKRPLTILPLLLCLTLYAREDRPIGGPKHPHLENPRHQNRAGAAADHGARNSPTACDAIVDSVRVFCLYGSIPAKGWERKEPMHGPNSMLGRMVKLHGGHVTVEYERDKALSFQPIHYDGPGGAGHLMPRSNAKNFNSCFRIYNAGRAW